MNNLTNYGASERFFIDAAFYPTLNLARVISQYKDLYKIATQQGETLAEISGKFRHKMNNLSDFPVVGDFVMVDRTDSTTGNAIIHKVLTRKSALERTAVGMSNQSQVIAANIDVLFLCMSLNHDYNLSRLERYLSAAWNSCATPVVVLTKVDLCSDLSRIKAEVSAAAIGTDILSTSYKDKTSCEQLLPYLSKGVTASFIGSSGVGKSTLINQLVGEDLLTTSETRQDDKGRHTTTRRDLLILPQGGIVIDTPGMREFGVESTNLSKSFVDIDELAAHCKFRDCTHTSEPDCAVQKAIQLGKLDERRLANYQKLKREAKYDGLSSRQIENEKINAMFKAFGGIKNAREFVKNKNKRK